MLTQIKKLTSRLKELEKELQSPEVASDPKKLQALSQEYSDIKDKVELGAKYEKTCTALEGAEQTKKESKDAEMIALAEEEISDLNQKKKTLEQELTMALLPQDKNDKKNIIMEIRAAAGGDESALFSAELYRLYSHYAEHQRWKVNVLSSNRIGIGGFKEIIFEIEGKGAYSRLKYESGVHRVQRVPETEKSGRVHTSTVTVAVLPEAEEIDLNIDPKDLKIETSTAQGHGGQSVNTTYSAIRMTHLPTGLVVSCQDERSQQQNREKAMTIMRSRLLQMEQEKAAKERADARLGQVGTGDRSEKIRTYNFPQDRVTDHRIKQNFGMIDRIMYGEIDEIINALQEEDIKKKLEKQA
ncbi:MAG: peptide chain release factor 1 [Parcubacteria group bacterium CG1_02_41_12]|nr:MAG: peptide chain release factor 1 [Parcubacteria group bacterium CG1_02_41_12]PIP66794.1 MAG: peptide chain release factor 1 [Parcubacteria group bacterium CG22_combo_CG10-13_8_21_14_all_41_9]PIQ79151.1 MAG: peptide chain release factor 1 [Parcubacteria group bacterium CG11_big_fil_rev_8_21_14_0_20_41_14]PIR56768.1 MAG: peptide chain release factor 1 [Parcubacteria group bacterium CG10_big_fil_rev_8_21_14_0_10_41_35]PIZ81291.1 MAG: peptide chain release factor 1 [Parcubacteria group bacter